VIDRVGPVASKVFQHIDQISNEKSIVVVFVYLPTDRDMGRDRPWRRWIVSAMDTLKLPFIDLTPALRSVPAERAGAFFIPQAMPAEGHYTEAGNDWVAEVLYERLMAVPRVQALLAGTELPDRGEGQ
jgi:hypothetical protein